ncbi:hypothetical protein ACXR0O_03390 [Verrucomicrobiota bacterium sgz303538]
MRLLWLSLGLLITAGISGCVSREGASGVVVHDDEGGPEGARSANLDADIRTMWSVVAKAEGVTWVAATAEAVLAANRVFNTVDLRGLTRDQVAKKLRFDLRSSEYGYYAPFWLIARGDLPIRIDTGCYGWQFDVHFTPDEKVIGVTRRWIH